MEELLHHGQYEGSLFGVQGDSGVKPHSRRSMLQIRMEILRVVMNGSGKPTQIMYRANLSWSVLQSQLKLFLQGDLLNAIEYGSRRKYVITEKGVDLVKSYERVVGAVLNEQA